MVASLQISAVYPDRRQAAAGRSRNRRLTPAPTAKTGEILPNSDKSGSFVVVNIYGDRRPLLVRQAESAQDVTMCGLPPFMTPLNIDYPKMKSGIEMTLIRKFVILCLFAFLQPNAFSQVVEDDCLDATVTVNQIAGIIDSGNIQRGVQVILLEHATGDVFIKRIVKINNDYVYIHIKCIKASKESPRKRIVITIPKVLPEQFNEIEKIQSIEKISEMINSKLNPSPYPSGIRFGEYDIASKQWKTIKVPTEYKSVEQPEIKMIFKFFDKFEIID